MELYVDNTSAINLVQNWSTSGHSKHIDICFHHICELVEQGMIKLNFVHTNNNTANIFTKNLGNKLFNKHCALLCLSNTGKVV